MITYKLVTTAGVAQTSWLSNVTDLAIAGSGGQMALIAATHLGGGVSSYRITDPATPITQLATRPYPAAFTYGGTPEITLLSIGGRDLVHIGELSGAASRAVPFNAVTGHLAPFDLAFSAGLPAGEVTALHVHPSAGGDLLLSAHSTGLVLNVHRAGADGVLTRQSHVSIPPPGDAAEHATITRITSTVVEGQTIVLTLSGNGNFLTTHLLSDQGQLDAGTLHRAGMGLGYDQPSQLAVLEVAGQTYVLLGSGGSHSLSVFRLDAQGRLTGTDHVIDELTTRFRGVSALDAVQIDGRSLIFVGGADDGISVFTLLPGGRLLHLETIADTATTTLADVSAIRAAVVEGRIALFVASATETGITQFMFDPGHVGTTGMASNGNHQGGSRGDLLVARPGTTRLDGGAGNDILVAGAAPITLTGGAGADIFVLSRVQGRIIITDYEHGVDRIDMSMLGMIRSIWQLRFIPTQTGVLIAYGETLVDVQT
ncbi:MAG: hypothetical protein P3W94_004505, partial [Paracoccus sp. (in: a-proteobacteria)]|nr:hypothetical protein [Paracoccus sp. (in: a-proteobacteria)]